MYISKHTYNYCKKNNYRQVIFLLSRNGKLNDCLLDVSPDSLECWGCIALRLHRKRRIAVQESYPNKEEDLHFIKSCEVYSLFSFKEIFQNSSDIVGCIKPGNLSAKTRTCWKAAKDEYSSIMHDALNDLEKGNVKEATMLRSSSFVYEHFGEKNLVKNSFCQCKVERSSQAESMEVFDAIHKGVGVNADEMVEGNDADQIEEGDDADQIEEGDNDLASYLIYCNDLSGLKAHDSYKFLISVCAERILVRSSEMHEFVTFVESMLFVDSFR